MFKEILPNGSLKTKAILSRIGVQQYDGVGVYRPVDEVRKSAASFTGMTVTFVHPKGGEVTSLNIKDTVVGTVLESYYQEDIGVVVGTIVIFDPIIVDLLLNSNKQYYISLGYSCNLAKESGIWVDEGNLSRTGILNHPYEMVQRNIIANHAAIVDNPRAGEIAKIFVDSETENNNHIFKEINHISPAKKLMDVNEILSKLLVAMDAMSVKQADMYSKMEDMSGKMCDMGNQMVDMKGAMTPAVTDSQDSTDTFQSVINSLVNAKVIDSNYSECKSVRDLNVAIAKQLMPSITITDSMSDEFIRGLIAAKSEFEQKAAPLTTSMSRVLSNQVKQTVDSQDGWDFEIKRG